MFRPIFFIPLTFFIILAGVLFYALNKKDGSFSQPESSVGQTFPEFEVASLFDKNKKVTQETLKGSVTLFHVFASWCSLCQKDHERLVNLQEKKPVKMIGLNFKDKKDQAQEWLNKHKNIFVHVGFDEDGQIAQVLEIYGVPETYILDKEGKIRFRKAGPLTTEEINNTVIPLIEKLENG